MKNTTARRAALSIVVAAALSGAAACSSSGGSDDSGAGGDRGGKDTARVGPLAALRSAARSTDRAESAKVRSTTVLGSLMSMRADGSLGWGDGVTGTLTITYTGGTTAETMRRLGTTSMEARYLRDAYYARMGDTFAEQTGGRHWIRYGYDDLADIGGASGAYLKDQMQNTTPNQSVKLLLASGDVRKVGEETVSGKRTTHYSGTVNVAALAARGSDLSAGQVADLKKQLTQAGVTTETVDIWVDDQDLLVKKVEKADMAAGAMTQTAYYSDYGVKVSAEAPQASDTEDFAELMKKQGGTGTS
ncbi:hypothetical protein AB0F77_08875 [Streptomyces sp. NPDC026672]|uniref:hypothetical protein n=1 Tax=unclassified Streptomyces TaxID=2593676 RepID=UPI0033F70DE1